jgi:hypothetical protein
MENSAAHRQFVRAIQLREAALGVWYTWRSPGLWLAFAQWLTLAVLLPLPLVMLATLPEGTATVHLGRVHAVAVHPVAEIGLDRSAVGAALATFGSWLGSLALVYWTQPSSYSPSRLRVLGLVGVALTVGAAFGVEITVSGVLARLASYNVVVREVTETSFRLSVWLPTALWLPPLLAPASLRPAGPSHLPPLVHLVDRA